MFSYDPMNIHLENITVDCNLLMGGFTIYSAWNYPEANTHDTQIIKNITFYQSGDRNVSIVDTMLSYRIKRHADYQKHHFLSVRR